MKQQLTLFDDEEPRWIQISENCKVIYQTPEERAKIFALIKANGKKAICEAKTSQRKTNSEPTAGHAESSTPSRKQRQ